MRRSTEAVAVKDSAAFCFLDMDIVLFKHYFLQGLPQ